MVATFLVDVDTFLVVEGVVVIFLVEEVGVIF